MKFKQYLNEGRTKAISHDETVDFILNNCKKHFKSIYMTGKTMPIYRGLSDKIKYGFIDTNKGTPRVSANTFNYMTLLMDNLPSWSKYPKRSRGLICSTDKFTASNYGGWGDINHVIPYDNSKIAVASDNDIWVSFEYMIDSVDDFNSYLNHTFKTFLKPNPNITTWNDLKYSLIETNRLYDFKEDKDRDYHDQIFKTDFFDPKQDIIKYLNKILSPTKNKMKLGIKNLDIDREVWIQGKSILVNEDYMNIVIKDVIDEI